MSGPTATEQATSSIPGAENAHWQRETSIARASHYPIVKDTLTYADTFLTTHALTSALYHRVAALSASILKQLEPLQKRFQQPLSLADGYANRALDFVEEKVPQIKMETGELVGRARQPADQAYEVAQGYKNGIQQRISPVTDQIYQRIEQGQKTLNGIQERLATAVKNGSSRFPLSSLFLSPFSTIRCCDPDLILPGKDNVPHDLASTKELLHAFQSELDTLAKALGSLPANAQKNAKPIVDGFKEAANDVRSELTRQDIPLGAKAANVVAYSQDRIAPIFEQVKAYVAGKKSEAQDKAGEVKDKAAQ
ncbi:hypothetical protein JCM8547_008980 [Rhodosporidiobolus lusitaniae]